MKKSTRDPLCNSLELQSPSTVSSSLSKEKCNYHLLSSGKCWTNDPKTTPLARAVAKGAALAESLKRICQGNSSKRITCSLCCCTNCIIQCCADSSSTSPPVNTPNSWNCQSNVATGDSCSQLTSLGTSQTSLMSSLNSSTTSLNTSSSSLLSYSDPSPIAPELEYKNTQWKRLIEPNENNTNDFFFSETGYNSSKCPLCQRDGWRDNNVKLKKECPLCRKHTCQKCYELFSSHKDRNMCDTCSILDFSGATQCAKESCIYRDMAPSQYKDDYPENAYLPNNNILDEPDSEEVFT